MITSDLRLHFSLQARNKSRLQARNTACVGVRILAMVIGHYAPALGLKALAPRVPLWVLFLAVQVLDLAFMFFVLADIEHVRIVPGFTASNDLDLVDMPWSHSLVASVAWSALAGAVAGALVPGARWRAALAVAAAVFSHYVLDAVVHVPDLTLAGAGTPRIGLGLWNHLPVALAVEAALFAGGAWILVRSSWAGAAGRRAAVTRLAAVMLLLLVVTYLIPTPPTPAALAASGLGTFAALSLAAGFLVDRGSRAAPSS
jgi:hypothetical protein